MPGTAPPPAAVSRRPARGPRPLLVRLLCGIMEGILLLAVGLSPWAFGANELEFEFILFAVVAVLLSLWGVRMLLEWQCRWVKCPLALCLAGLFLVAAGQLIPLPPRLLGWLAPGTARLYGQMLPAQAELLPYGESRVRPPASTGSTISLYPGRTREDLTRLLAVLLLFGVVRQNIASAASLRRLSVVALVNGTLLSWFGLFQALSSPDRHTLYWRIPYSGTVFGPFGCSNHFACYVNLCVGLSIGLLLSLEAGQRGKYREDSGAALFRTGDLLANPRALWVCVALAFMFTGVAFSLSRGGLVALLVTLGGFLAFGFLRYHRLSLWSACLVSLVIGLGLLMWLGSARVHDRLATVWEGKAFRESRLPIWSRLLPLAGEFPIWGTGYGTLPYVESMHRTDTVNAEEICMHAENEYLEALVEGGGIRLALALLAIGLVYRLGYRAIVSSARTPRRPALAIGALFAFTTLVIHSLVDFGLHIPAIAFLATVLCAQLSVLGSAAGRTRHETRGTQLVLRSRWRFAAPVVGCLLALILGTVLCREGWRTCQVHWFRHGVSRLRPTPQPVSAEQRLADLQEAARLDPASATVQVELALIYYDRYRQARQQAKRHRLADLSQVGSLVGLIPAGYPQADCLAGVVSSLSQRLPGQEEQNIRRHLVPALKYFMLARDLSPVLQEPHRYLAYHVELLGRAGPRLAYLERVLRLAPHDAGIWYWSGLECQRQEPERAWKCWRQALELSEDYLAVVLESARKSFSPRDVMEEVIPERPWLLLTAALQLFPESEAVARRPYLERALTLLNQQSGPTDAASLHLRARLQVALGDPGAARQAYEAALLRSPQEINWRYEYAQFLRRQGQLPEARRELLTVLRQQSGYAPAQQLLAEVVRELDGRD